MALNGRTQLRQQLARDTSIGEQARDVQAGFDSIPRQLLRKVAMNYSEPMTLGGFTSSPEGIEVLRVVPDLSPSTALPVGGLCHFDWLPQQGGAVIRSIDGMSPTINGGIRYRFTFRLTFASS